jgi:hypothetical protein
MRVINPNLFQLRRMINLLPQKHLMIGQKLNRLNLTMLQDRGRVHLNAHRDRKTQAFADMRKRRLPVMVQTNPLLRLIEAMCSQLIRRPVERDDTRHPVISPIRRRWDLALLRLRLNNKRCYDGSGPGGVKLTNPLSLQFRIVNLGRKM